MSKLIAARTAQYPLAAEFTVNIAADSMVNAAGALDDFKAVAAHAFDVIPLPVGATITGGSVTTATAVTGSTAYAVTIGDSAVANRYMASTDKTAAGITALVPTGYVGAGENVRMTVTPTVAASTAGKLIVRIEYTVANRSNEVQIA